MSDNDPDVEQLILAAYSRLLVENYCIIASSVLLFSDWAMTFPSEVQHIWHRKITGATVVYLLTRYAAMAERVTLSTSVFLQTLQDQSCVPVLRLDDALTNLTYLASGVFIVFRVWGIWGKDWRPHLVLVPLCVAPTVINVYLDTTYSPVALGPPLYGCGALWQSGSLVSTNLSLGVVSAAVMIASNTILLILTWVRTYGLKKESTRLGMNTPLVTLLIRDGTLYFVLILIVQILNIVSKQVGSAFVLFDVWPLFDEVFVVVFLSRFILDLRGVYPLEADASVSTPEATLHVSDLRFTSTVIGNMGAPLAGSPRTQGRGLSTASDSTDYSEYGDDDTLEVSRDPFMAGLERPGDIEMV